MTHLQKGDRAPEFSAVDHNGNTISLANYKGKKVVLYFYPKDMTPGCTAEACSFRDEYAQLQQKGFEIIGVSADDAKRHAKFTEKYELPFPLIPDTDHELIKAYGVWGLKKFMGREYDGIHRETFVIDENGLIERVITKVKSKAAAEQILEAYE